MPKNNKQCFQKLKKYNIEAYKIIDNIAITKITWRDNRIRIFRPLDM